MASKTIIFIDGDDTLWDTQGLYDRAISKACEKVRLKGFDVSHWGLPSELQVAGQESLRYK